MGSVKNEVLDPKPHTLKKPDFNYLPYLTKLEPGRKGRSRRNAFLALHRQQSPKSESLFAFQQAVQRPKITDMSKEAPELRSQARGLETLASVLLWYTLSLPKSTARISFAR